MLLTIVKHFPPRLKANKICRCFYWAAMEYIEIPIRGSFCSLRGWLYYVHHGYKLEKFKDIHKGQRCFIIGNGPSILQQDLTKLKDEITFVVSWFVLHEQYDEINPTYYCVGDPAFFSVSNTNSQVHRLLLEKTGKAVKFFPLFFRSFIDRHNLYVGHQVFYLHSLYKRVWKTGSMSLDITKAVYTANTVIIDYCLHLAFYMGFSEVYLLGCDCDFKLDEAPDFSKAHFYPQELAGELPPQTGDLEQQQNEVFNTINIFSKSYSVAKETFEKQGRKIYNAGIGGKLEVFERVNYDELF